MTRANDTSKIKIPSSSLNRKKSSGRFIAVRVARANVLLNQQLTVRP